METQKRGKLIILEGADGTGKTTQAENIAEYLIKCGKLVVQTKEPGSEVLEFNKDIRKRIFAIQEQDFLSTTLQELLFLVDHLNNARHIEKWLSEGKWVVCDRWGYISNLAYLQFKKPCLFNVTEMYKELEIHIPKPDKIIFLSAPSTTVQKRLTERKGKDITQDQKAWTQADIYHTKMEEIYSEIKKDFHNSVIVRPPYPDGAQIVFDTYIKEDLNKLLEI